MKTHHRNTYQSGADRMLFDECWHSSASLDKIHVGDILRVLNKNTLEVTDWEVTGTPAHLSPDEARTEWHRYPFGNERFAERNGYYPFILTNLRMVAVHPPKTPSPRNIPSVVRRMVYLRDGGRCKHCGAETELEFDHMIPVARSGSNTENNIELLCRSCNAKKSDRVE